MASNFKINTKGLEKALGKAADEAVKEVARKAQPDFDRLQQEHSGKPVAEVEPHVRALFRKLGWNMDQAGIRRYSQAISDGRRVELKPGKTQL